MREQKSNYSPVQTITPATYTADTNGNAADLTGFQSATIIAQIGVSGDTLDASNYLEIELEESNDNSTWTDVADKNILATVTGNNTGTIAKIEDAAEDDTIILASYTGNKKYIRPVLNFTGTHTNGIPVGVSVLRGDAQYNPVN